MSKSRLTIAQIAEHVGRHRTVVERDCRIGLLHRSPKIPGITGRIELTAANKYIRLKFPTTTPIAP